MQFDWDALKSERNRVQRGFDFLFASHVFAGTTVEHHDLRADYGEVRVIAFGRVAGITLTVVYTDRRTDGGIIRRIISARRSKRRERRAYEEAQGTTP